MTFNIIEDGDDLEATPAMQNWRHVNYGNDLLPVDSNGDAVDSTLNIGSATYRWADIHTDALTIAGDSTITGDYKYNSADTRYESIEIGDLIVVPTGATYNSAPAVTNSAIYATPANAQDIYITFPIKIPNGSTITEFKLYLKSSSGDIFTCSVYLDRIAYSDVSSSVVGNSTGNTISGDSLQTITISSWTNPVIDKSTYTYSCRIVMTNFNGNEDYVIHGAKITYTITQL